MKLIILILAIGACLANPVEELESMFKEALQAKATPNSLDTTNLFEHEADESQNAPEVEKDSVALGPVGPVVNEKDIKVGQPIDLLPAELKPEGGDLKTDATYWYGRSWGYPSWGYAYPHYGRSYYRPRHYYRPSFYSWYW